MSSAINSTPTASFADIDSLRHRRKLNQEKSEERRKSLGSVYRLAEFDPDFCIAPAFSPTATSLSTAATSSTVPVPDPASSLVVDSTTTTTASGTALTPTSHETTSSKVGPPLKKPKHYMSSSADAPPTLNVINDTSKIVNDYNQYFVDKGKRPQNFIRDSDLVNPLEVYA